MKFLSIKIWLLVFILVCGAGSVMFGAQDEVSTVDSVDLTDAVLDEKAIPYLIESYQYCGMYAESTITENNKKRMREFYEQIDNKEFIEAQGFNKGLSHQDLIKYLIECMEDEDPTTQYRLKVFKEMEHQIARINASAISDEEKREKLENQKNLQEAHVNRYVELQKKAQEEQLSKQKEEAARRAEELRVWEEQKRAKEADQEKFKAISHQYYEQGENSLSVEDRKFRRDKMFSLGSLGSSNLESGEYTSLDIEILLKVQNEKKRKQEEEEYRALISSLQAASSLEEKKRLLNESLGRTGEDPISSNEPVIHQNEVQLPEVVEIKAFPLNPHFPDIAPIEGEKLYYVKDGKNIYVISQSMKDQYNTKTQEYDGAPSYGLDLENKKLRTYNPSCGPGDRPRSWDFLSEEEVEKLPKYVIPTKKDKPAEVVNPGDKPDTSGIDQPKSEDGLEIDRSGKQLQGIEPKSQGAGKPENKPKVPVVSKYKYYLGAGLTAATIVNFYMLYVAKQAALKKKLAKINADESLTVAQKSKQIKKAKAFFNVYALTTLEAIKMAALAAGWVGFGII